MSCDCPTPSDFTMSECLRLDEIRMQEQALESIKSDITEAEHYVLSVLARFFTKEQVLTIAYNTNFPERFFEYGVPEYHSRPLGPKGIKYKYEVMYLFNGRKTYYLMKPHYEI